ncbi:MAG: hypothetical protein QXR87_03385 [Candidatus Hadarchaeales archaeon]
MGEEPKKEEKKPPLLDEISRTIQQKTGMSQQQADAWVQHLLEELKGSGLNLDEATAFAQRFSEIFSRLPESDLKPVLAEFGAAKSISLLRGSGGVDERVSKILDSILPYFYVSKIMRTLSRAMGEEEGESKLLEALQRIEAKLSVPSHSSDLSVLATRLSEQAEALDKLKTAFEKLGLSEREEKFDWTTVASKVLKIAETATKAISKGQPQRKTVQGA